MGKMTYEHKNDKSKKLSWMYRKKIRMMKAKDLGSNAINSGNTDNKNARIIVRNLSFRATDEDVRRFYEPFGGIKEINLLRRSDGRLVGCGFIQFERMEDASKAIFNTNKKEFLGRIINSDWAMSKSDFCEKLKKDSAVNEEIDKDGEQISQDIQNRDESNNVHWKQINNSKKQERLKRQKINKQRKRARIIIRNLSFQVTEDNLKEYFSKYGEIDDIQILTRTDGKRIGCAFVQFKLVQSAAKALHYANMQLLLDRPMILDWAIPKNKFLKNNTNKIDVKPEIKTEIIEQNDVQDIPMKVLHNNENEVSDSDVELDSKKITLESIKTDDESDKNEISIKDEVENIDNEDDNVDYDDNISDNEENKSDYKKNNFDSQHSRRISNDVNEGRTVFLKNLPFSVKNDELKRHMEQFGPVCYALICIDPLTEYSKGTAFVKFKNAADAEKCLLTGTELCLHDQVIEMHRALHRNEIENKKSFGEQRIKDSRNLYLVKEGVVLAGSLAAMEVSTTDMAKRLKLEQWKSQMLRNLNMFISRVRLVIHNLPANFDDTKLRQLFKNHTGPKAIIREARVMRDLKNVDAANKGKSKEYGFVTFTSHEDALKALRDINNNPKIFTKHRRPIVGFSIENRIMVNAKEKRIKKSRDHNPLWSGNKNKRKSEDTKEETPHKHIKKSDDTGAKSYVGISGRLGQDKLRSNFNLKSQAALHMRTIKKQKKLNKAAKQLQITKKEKAQEKQKNMPMKQLKKFNADDANFNKLVNNYRSKLKEIDLKKSKWYETVKES